MKYCLAAELDAHLIQIANKLGIRHDFSRVKCIRSTGSKSRAIARCHALPKVMQLAMDMKAHYVIEVISEVFDKLSEEEKTKVLIHELLHIPKAFGGGFRHHDYVTRREIDRMYAKFVG